MANVGCTTGQSLVRISLTAGPNNFGFSWAVPRSCGISRQLGSWLLHSARLCLCALDDLAMAYIGKGVGRMPREQGHTYKYIYIWYDINITWICYTIERTHTHIHIYMLNIYIKFYSVYIYDICIYYIYSTYKYILKEKTSVFEVSLSVICATMSLRRIWSALERHCRNLAKPVPFSRCWVFVWCSRVVPNAGKTMP